LGGRLVYERVISSSGVIEEIEVEVEKLSYVGIEVDICDLPQVKKNMAACVF
jgi:hypothetical protein